QLLKDGFVVNTILKEADLFCPNSVRINFTIYHRITRFNVTYHFFPLLSAITLAMNATANVATPPKIDLLDLLTNCLNLRSCSPQNNILGSYLSFSHSGILHIFNFPIISYLRFNSLDIIN
ncbi:hypothetical protein EFE20_06225, partial [Latilactobacillus curvatus]|nr:hypothetical protein [Latilactobacillus curvatus]MCS8606387.1 hypothetical protein [Latilactobacillus curvatus]